MIKLIYYELKKIFKKKINIIMTILIFGFCAYNMIDKIQNEYIMQFGYTTFDGKEMNVNETYRYIDDFLHKYAGNVDQGYLQKMNVVYHSIVKEFEMNQPDEEVMKKVYGEHYKELIQAGVEGTMTQNEILELSTKVAERFQYCAKYVCVLNTSETTFELKQFNKNYMGYELLNYMMKDGENYRAASLLNRKDNVLDYEKIHNDTENMCYGFMCTDADITKEEVAWYNEKYLNTPTTIDSDVGAKLLIEQLDGSVTYGRYGPLLLILLIMILLSDIFSIENRNKVEDYLVCMKNGSGKLVCSKLIAALLVVLGVILGFVLMNVAYISTIVPIRTLDMVNISFIQPLYTYKQIIIRELSLLFATGLSVAAICMIMSCFTKKLFFTPIVVFLICIFPLFTYGKMVTNFFPLGMVNTLGYIGYAYKEYYGLMMEHITLFNKIIPLSNVVTFTWIVIFIFCGVLCYLNKKRHVVR